ncbi:MAG: cytidine deaminase [Alphaproteobacteria bacterium]|nr:cytidine deaminase [Alphaproteobacteria bacterium]
MAKLEELYEVAKKTKRNAYASRSEHKLGAAVLTKSGNIYGGCNIESNISGLGICAERAAINQAIVNGEYQLDALMLLDDDFGIPCGACLQYLMEFSVISKTNTMIVSANKQGKFNQYALFDLLPYGYISKNKTKAKDYGKRNK